MLNLVEKFTPAVEATTTMASSPSSTSSPRPSSRPSPLPSSPSAGDIDDQRPASIDHPLIPDRSGRGLRPSPRRVPPMRSYPTLQANDPVSSPSSSSSSRLLLHAGLRRRRIRRLLLHQDRRHRRRPYSAARSLALTGAAGCLPPANTVTSSPPRCTASQRRGDHRHSGTGPRRHLTFLSIRLAHALNDVTWKVSDAPTADERDDRASCHRPRRLPCPLCSLMAALRLRHRQLVGPQARTAQRQR